MSFANVLKKYLSGQDTGQLVVQFAEVDYLCKISIENDQAVYLSLGTLGPEQSLDFLQGRTALKAKFIAGVSARKHMAVNLNDSLLALALGSGTPARAAPTAAATDLETQVGPQEVDVVIENFIDIIGPLGRILAEKALSRMGCSQGNPMTDDQFATFLTALKSEVPEDRQEMFLARCRSR